MKKLFITLCGIAVLSGLSAGAFAENTNFSAENTGKPHKFSPEMKAKMEQKRAEFDKKLNLSPEQKEKMKAIHQASREKMKPLFEKMKVERTKLTQLIKNNASQQEIQAQKAKLRVFREQLKTERKANFEKVQAILTPEQQKEFNKMHEERQKNKNFEGKRQGQWQGNRSENQND